MSYLTRVWQISVVSLLLICSGSALAQWEKKPSAEWSDSDTQKVLNESPWVKKQQILNPKKSKKTTDFNNGDNGYHPTVPTTDQSSELSYTTYYIRLLSAKPMREAL